MSSAPSSMSSGVPSRRVGLVGEGLEQLAARLGFRCVDGFAEREIYREFFPRGLTGLDAVEAGEPGTAPAPAHADAQRKVLQLIDGLKLPLDETRLRRSTARQQWFAAQGSPLEVHDFIRA
jgi:chromosome partitioning protein